MVGVTSASIIVAVVSLVGAVGAALLAGYSVIWTEERKRHSSAMAILSKYQDPLLLAAAALHRKLQEILDKRGRHEPLHSTVLKDYNITYPAFLVGQFFSWVHILRIESQFLSIQRTHKTRSLADAFDAIEKAWTTDEGGQFTLWRGQQSAIGELMTVTDGHGQRSCIGYSTFRKRWYDGEDEFKQWFGDFVYSRDAKKRIEKVAAGLETLVKELDPKGLLMAAYSTFDVERGSDVPAKLGPNTTASTSRELTPGQSRDAFDTALAAGWRNWAQVTKYVTNKSLYRSSAPNYSGEDCTQQLTPAAVGYLADNGIDSIISFNEHPYNEDEHQLLRNAKINYLHLPVKDFGAPTLGQLEDAITFFTNPGQQSTLVHCGYGRGRTGTGVTALQLHATAGRKPDESEWGGSGVETKGQEAVLGQLVKLRNS
jgi:protein-tyrosine phosphatase